MHVCMYVSKFVCMYVCLYVCMYVAKKSQRFTHRSFKRKAHVNVVAISFGRLYSAWWHTLTDMAIRMAANMFGLSDERLFLCLCQVLSRNPSGRILDKELFACACVLQSPKLSSNKMAVDMF